MLSHPIFHLPYCLRCAGLVLCTCIALGWASAHAQVVWHCSKHQGRASAAPLTSIEQTQDWFHLSGFSSETITVSLNDLSDIYRGRRVQLGSQTLTGCFVTGDNPLNQAAYESIGLRWDTLQLMQRRSAIAPGQLSLVRTESDMLSCIANHYPAVGYLSQVHHNDEVAPCF